MTTGPSHGFGRVLSIEGDTVLVLCHETQRVQRWPLLGLKGTSTPAVGPAQPTPEQGPPPPLDVGDLITRTGERLARGQGQWPPEGWPLTHLDPAHWDRLKRRAQLTRGLRQFFDDEGFLEVETPILVPSAGTETHLDPIAVDYLPHPGAPLTRHYLITSPEYAMKRLLVGGSGPIWQLTKVFRDGERGRNHRPEFTMAEWYRPNVDGYGVLMEDCEKIFTHLNPSQRLTWQGKTYDLTPPWPRHTFFDLCRERADLRNPESLDPDRWFEVLVDRIEPTLGVDGPEFLIEWPIQMASLSRQKPGDPRVAERFELYLANLELANAFAELTDPVEQRQRCHADNLERETMNRPLMPLDPDFLGALDAGMPPSAGIALGWDRVVMLLTDASEIDQVLAF